jgi:DnaA-homolog protein
MRRPLSTMRQLLLELGAPMAQTLDTFTPGQNLELVQMVRQFAGYPLAMPQERFVYVWGEPGSGKTHLLRALAEYPGTRYIGPEDAEAHFGYTPETLLYLLDDCERLGPETQVAAFSLFNQVRENGGLMLTAGDRAPATLRVREDLRTRLGWGLIYQVHGLTDEEKIIALQQIASARGFAMSPGVLPYLITHFRRDMRSLAAMLNALDQYSLETQRPVTLPLLRSLLKLDEQADAP